MSSRVPPNGDPTPLVSVLMPTYNHQSYLAHAIDSVLHQDVDFSFELLIGEDASTDRTAEIARECQRRHPRQVRVLDTQVNLGPDANYRRLLAAARGSFVAYLDGDDYWLPGKLRRQVAFLEAHPDCAAVYGNALTVTPADLRIGLFNDVGDESFDLRAMLRRGNFLNTSTMVFRAPSLARLLAIDHPFIDFQIHLVHAQQGWLHHFGEPLAAYRVNVQGSMVTSKRERVRELYWQAIQSVPREMIRDEDYVHGMADFLRRVFFRSLRTGDAASFRAWTAKIYAASPYGKTYTSAVVAASILRMAAKMLSGQLGGSREGILYRR